MAPRSTLTRKGRPPHVLRFYGLPDGQIRVICDQCVPQWARTFEPGHTDADWQELSRQHSGPIT